MVPEKSPLDVSCAVGQLLPIEDKYMTAVVIIFNLHFSNFSSQVITCIKLQL